MDGIQNNQSVDQIIPVQAVQFCPVCHIQIPAADYFCPNCGKELHEKPLSTSVGKQIGIYLTSFFLPPLGLWPGIKYLRQKDQKAQVVGIIAVFLTILSIGLAVYYFMQFLSFTQQSMNVNLDKLQGY